MFGGCRPSSVRRMRGTVMVRREGGEEERTKAETTKLTVGLWFSWLRA